MCLKGLDTNSCIFEGVIFIGIRHAEKVPVIRGTLDGKILKCYITSPKF